LLESGGVPHRRRHRPLRPVLAVDDGVEVGQLVGGERCYSGSHGVVDRQLLLDRLRGP
jgi:hypothetical protein